VIGFPAVLEKLQDLSIVEKHPGADTVLLIIALLHMAVHSRFGYLKQFTGLLLPDISLPGLLFN